MEVQEDITRTKLLDEARARMVVAWENARNHRHNSDNILKLVSFCRLLGEDELIKKIGHTKYKNYGCPILKLICQRLNFEIPVQLELDRMSRGLPCEEDCGAGCG